MVYQFLWMHQGQESWVLQGSWCNKASDIAILMEITANSSKLIVPSQRQGLRVCQLCRSINSRKQTIAGRCGAALWAPKKRRGAS